MRSVDKLNCINKSDKVVIGGINLNNTLNAGLFAITALREIGETNFPKYYCPYFGRRVLPK